MLACKGILNHLLKEGGRRSLTGVCAFKKSLKGGIHMNFIKTHKIKIIAITVVIAILAIAWFYDGMVNSRVVHPTPLVENAGVEQCSDVLDYINTDELYKIADEYESSDEPDNAETIDAVGETTPPNTEHDTTFPVAQEHLESPASRTPVEPEDMVSGDGSFTVTLSVRVDTLLHNMHILHRDKHELVPADAIIFPVTQVTAFEGESVFNVLQREMRRHGIHMASRFTPVFNSAYVEAINNLYEFDVGELSGWMYKVNGWFPNFGSSRFVLSPDDIIEWHYTVDLGRDLGEFSLAGQRDD